MKIAIIGAGASGLSAAHTLKTLGYKDITLFERAAYVGGKSCSYQHQGRIYELGTVWLNQDYQNILRFARRYNVKIIPATLTPIMDRKGDVDSYPIYILKRHNLIKLTRSLVNYFRVAHRFSNLREPGFVDVHPDLHMTFDDFVRKYKMKSIAEVMSSFITACGYGYYNTVPAMYFLKLISFKVQDATRCLLRGWNQGLLQTIQLGWQHLWEEVAKEFEVRLDCAVSQVSRSEVGGRPKIGVTTNGKTELFDRLIVSSLLNRCHRFMDLTAEEKTLFNKIHSHRYLVSLIEAKGLDHATLQENLIRGPKGHIVAVGHFHPDRNVYNIYQLVPPSMSIADANQRFQDDIKRLGGHFDNILFQKEWDYFPYVTTEDLNRGFYRRLDLLQGARGTYYIGGIMNFETVELTSRYAEYLVKREFRPAQVQADSQEKEVDQPEPEYGYPQNTAESEVGIGA